MNTQFTEILQEQTIKRLSTTGDGERVKCRFIWWPRRDAHGKRRWLEYVWCYEEFIGGYVGRDVMADSKWHRTLLTPSEPRGLLAYINQPRFTKRAKPHIGGQMAIDFVLGLLKETDPKVAAEDLLEKLQPWTAGPEYTVGPVDYKTSW